MSYYSTNELKPGTKILLDGEPFVTLGNEYVKPGKGQAFNRLTLRNLKTKRVLERTVKSHEKLAVADILEIEVDCLYSDAGSWHFMMPDTYEQFAVPNKVVGETGLWLKAQARCVLTLFNQAPLSVTPPTFIILAVTETDPGLRGDTSSGGNKPAILETGAVVRLPLFVQIGDLVKVDTREGIYLERVKE